MAEKDPANKMLGVYLSAGREALARFSLGLDVHKSYPYAVAIDESGRSLLSGRLNNHRLTLGECVHSLPDRVKVVPHPSGFN